MCAFVCVCVCVRERERERVGEIGEGEIQRQIKKNRYRQR